MGGGVSSLPVEVSLAEAKELAGARWQPAWEEKFADAEAKISRDDAVRCWTEAKANADGPASKGAGPLDERKDAGARWKKGVAKVGWISHAKAAAIERAQRAGIPWQLYEKLHGVSATPVSYTHLTLPTNREV